MTKYVCKHLWLGTAACTMIVGGCSPDVPNWINEAIENFQSEPVDNPPRSIYRYTYQDQTVYYIPGQCCDQFSTLYDVDGNEICAPDGGLTGEGDGRCPDFFEQRTNELLLWEDSRR